MLSPSLIRLEYAGDGAFENGSTFTVVQRPEGIPDYSVTVEGGFLEMRTSAQVLRYRQGSGPFTPQNTSVTVISTGQSGSPAFPSTCSFGSSCEAEDALLTGTATTAYDHEGHTGIGFVANIETPGTGVIHRISNIPASGQYRLQVRYANARGSDGQHGGRTLATTVDGAPGPVLELPATESWDTWSVASVALDLRAGTSSVGVGQTAGSTGKVNLDAISVTAADALDLPGPASDLLTTAYGAGPASPLGGWYRSLDNVPDDPTGTELHPGILNRGGWYLLDDTRTALRDADGTVRDRQSHDVAAYQDGYLFAYGQDYPRALADLNLLTGRTAMLPRSAYGVWFSRYHPYTDQDYREHLVPDFARRFTPLDWLVLDTDFKAPGQWDGWSWNRALFPDPQGFLDWSHDQGLSVALNVHPSIASDDPQFAATREKAPGLRRQPPGFYGEDHYSFDWSDDAHRNAYFDLHEPFEDQGVDLWWLDYCTNCGTSTASNPHIAPDNFINQAYADRQAARGLRGFAFSRIGAAQHTNDHGSYPVGVWSERRNTLQFTGDTPATWEMLTYQAQFTADEAAAGLSNISHDIGSFDGKHLPDDMYARWVQLGTFQPTLRLHSDHGDRLPWEYGAEAEASATRFLRLRESLVPYTYTLAREAHDTGLPIVRPLYLEFPDHDDAYLQRGEYLYGDDVLVAPITTPAGADGVGSVDVWIPPGTWTDYFTGTSYTGPARTTITAPLARMPVLIRAGGILPMRTDYVANQAESPLAQLTVNVAAGVDGSFELYEDAGEGHGYAGGEHAVTPLTWSDQTSTLTVGATEGTYPGAVDARRYTVRVYAGSAPTSVTVDGERQPETAWSFNADSGIVTVSSPALRTRDPHTIRLHGSAPDNPRSGWPVGLDGMCLESAAAIDGAAIQIAPCGDDAHQQLTLTQAGELRTVGSCVDVAGGGTSNGTPVHLWGCNASAAQIWTPQTDGSLLNPQSGRCLDVPSANAEPRAAQLQVWDCNGTPAQSWTLSPSPVRAETGQCLDVYGADPASGTPVQLFTCNGTDAQRWIMPGDGTLRVLGKCLDVVGGRVAPGTPLQLWDCNGTPAQSFIAAPDGSLRNAATGLCVDRVDDGRTSGPVAMKLCRPGVETQRYHAGV